MRKALAALHRWAALAAGALLLVSGLSGSLMVWQAELDAALNPAWFAPPALRCAPAERP
ncbi:PepSY domain-containing protein, partial [Rubrivivax gelatinosus]